MIKIEIISKAPLDSNTPKLDSQSTLADADLFTTGLILPDPLGLQPAETDAPFMSDSVYNHLARSVIFGRETPAQRQIRIALYGEKLNAGIKTEIELIQRNLIKLKEFTTDESLRTLDLSGKVSLDDLRKVIADKTAEKLRLLSQKQAERLALIRDYFSADFQAGQNFRPAPQTGYTCVPMAMQEICQKIAPETWPYKSVDQAKTSFAQAAGGVWTDPNKIYSFIRELHANQNLPLVSRPCQEPLTLAAAISRGGMAVAKALSWDHVYIFEAARKAGDDLVFDIGNTLGGGSVKAGVSLAEVDKEFFQISPTERTSVSVIAIVPLPRK